MSRLQERWDELPRRARVAVGAAALPVTLVVFALRNPPSDRGLWRTTIIVGAIAWFGTIGLIVSAGGTGDEPEAVTSSTEQQSGATTSSTTTTEPTTTTRPDAPEGGFRTGDTDVIDDGPPDAVSRDPAANDLLATLASLRVEPEHAAGYDRSLFPHWDDADGDGCDTRCEVLSSQRRADGTWFSEWDGATVVDASESHIDHVVALAEAWRSGAHAWSPADRDRFADDRPNLLAVSAASNVRKSDHDAAGWFPSRSAANCLWASTVVRVKANWDLAVDRAERDALANLLRTCDDYVPPTTTTTAPPSTTSPPPTASGNCHPSYPDVCIPPPPPDLDCGDIEHRDFRVVGDDPHRFDGNGDGVGCES